MSYTISVYHIVFRTKASQRVLVEENERELYQYINGFVRQKGGVLYRINGMPDHVHLLVSIPPSIALADFVRDMKVASNGFIKQHPSLFPQFVGWAAGYFAGSVSHEHIERVRNYIMGQKEHHRKGTLSDELRKLLSENGIAINEQYFPKDV